MTEYFQSILLAGPDAKFEVLGFRLVLAALMGFIIGLEREIASKGDHELFAGTRTFSLVAILGFAAAHLSHTLSFWILPILLAGLMVFVVVSYYVASRNGDLGGTTDVSIVLVFLAGVLVNDGQIRFAVLLTVLVLSLLSLKLEFKNFIGKIQHHEVLSFMQFVILVAVILPLLPNEDFGSFGVINPRSFGIVVVLVVAINFVGYLLAKFLGHHRGTIITGLIGGLFSSTAVAWSFSQKKIQGSVPEESLASAILAASSIMFVRVLVVLSVINLHLMKSVLAPFLAMTVAGFFVSAHYSRKNRSNKMENSLLSKNPLNVVGAAKFAVLFLIILFVVKLSLSYFGEKGLYFASFISGLTDVDAISISVAKLAGSYVAVKNAAFAVMIAVLSNTCVKFAITMIFGSRQLKLYCAKGFGVILASWLTGFGLLMMF